MKITGQTRIFTILAHPSTHVVAPMIYNSIFEALGLDMAYIAHDVPPAAIEAAITAYRSWENLAGFNVTVPHKEYVARLLDKMLPPVDRIGVVNTVVRSQGGSLTGYNTDGIGAVAAIGGAEKARCLLIGAGGAARAIVDALLEAGAARVCILNRSLERAESLMGLYPSGRVSLLADGPLEEIDIIVQATPITDRVPFDLDIGSFKKGTRVLETVMRETAFSREAVRNGLTLIPGHAMLYHQTQKNFLLLTGIDVSDTVIRKAFRSSGYSVP